MSAFNLQRLGEAVSLYFDIARLKKGPEDLPAAPQLMVATLIAYVIASLAFSALLPPQSAHPLLLLVIDTVLMLVWIHLILRVARKPERFVQTTAATFGFQLVLSPLFAIGMSLFLRMREDPAWQVPVSMLIVALGVWALIVNSRILNAATQWPVFACTALVIAQALAARGILLAIFPETVAAAS